MAASTEHVHMDFVMGANGIIPGALGLLIKDFFIYWYFTVKCLLIQNKIITNGSEFFPQLDGVLLWNTLGPRL